jgi:isochorismate hydrolase
MNNNDKATMKETSKNCVSDYPLSNTEIAERREAWHSSQSERAVVLLISLMKKLRVTLKRNGNVVEFLKTTMREGRFPCSTQRVPVVWRL